MSLAYLSIKEYFLSDAVLPELHALWPCNAHRVSRSHHAITRVSIAYLRQFSLGDSLTPTKLAEFPLARYAAQFRFRHATLANIDGGPLDIEMRKLFGIENEHIVFVNWIRLFNPDVPQEPPRITTPLSDIGSPFYYACLLGLNSLVAPLVPPLDDINDDCGFAGNALQAASSGGHFATVRLLLDQGADVNARSSSADHDVLQATSYAGNDQVFELLLNRGAKYDWKEGSSATLCKQLHIPVVARWWTVFLWQGPTLMLWGEDGAQLLQLPRGRASSTPSSF